MSFCRNCSHFDFEHDDFNRNYEDYSWRRGAPCTVTYGIWSDWPMDWKHEQCLCPGYQPEPT